jgi:peptidoglycan hydrolase-like protein with peptidoglycan-binding domain
LTAAREHLEPDRAAEPPERAQPRPAQALPAAVQAHAVAAGSARVAAFALARQPAPPGLGPAGPGVVPPGFAAAPGPLTEAEQQEAINWTTARYDELSVRIVQRIVGTPVTGTFDAVMAQAVATFQQARGLLVDGKVGHQTLTASFPERIAEEAHDQLIHLVADLEAIDITTETAAVRFDPTLATRGDASFESSGLRVIRLGPTAFQTSRILCATLRAQLRPAAPAAAVPGATPAVLSDLEAGVAALINQARLSHPHSVRAVSALVGGARDSAWSVDLAQRLADFQQTNGLGGAGVVDLQSLEAIVIALRDRGDNNGAIRLIVDFFDFDDAGNLISIYFDPTETANAETLPFDPANTNQPVSVQVGPRGMAQEFAGIVHTIEHEFEHVRQIRAGEGDLPTQEFLGEATEIVSATTPEEQLQGFGRDARRALDNWNLMPADRQVRHRDRFIQVRDVVRRRIGGAPAPVDPAHTQLLADYNAVVVPPAPPP